MQAEQDSKYPSCSHKTSGELHAEEMAFMSVIINKNPMQIAGTMGYFWRSYCPNLVSQMREKAKKQLNGNVKTGLMKVINLGETLNQN